MRRRGEQNPKTFTSQIVNQILNRLEERGRYFERMYLRSAYSKNKEKSASQSLTGPHLDGPSSLRLTCILSDNAAESG